MIALAALLWLGPPVLPPVQGASVPSEEVAPEAPLRAPPEVSAPAPAQPQVPGDAEPGPGEVRHRARRPQVPEPLSTQALPVATADEVQGFAEDDALAEPEVGAHLDAPEGGPAPRRSQGKPGDLPVTPADASADPGPQVVIRTATPEPQPKRLTFKRRTTPPERSAAFVFAYRQFAIRDGLSRKQSWHFASLEVTPLRRYVRLSVGAEFGWEGGEAARHDDRADLMLLAGGALGVQYPHWVTPFVEFYGGAGVARVELFERNDLAFVYKLGVDVGGQWAVTRWLFLHAAVGWIRPVVRYADQSVRYDRATFKVGVGF